MQKLNQNNYSFWWQALLAVPFDKSEAKAYRRLNRIFMDRSLRLPGLPFRHQLTSSNHETHFTVSLFENFNLFNADSWLKPLWIQSGLASSLGQVNDCNWSYEWVAKIGSQERNLDIVIRYEDEIGSGILVVEAKKPGVTLKDQKDLDPGWHRRIPEFNDFSRFSFLYLLDDAVRDDSRTKIITEDLDIGFITWSELAAIQINCAREADLSLAVKGFIAASIYRQYSQLGITPLSPPMEYLEGESSIQELLQSYAKGLSSNECRTPHWME